MIYLRYDISHIMTKDLHPVEFDFFAKFAKQPVGNNFVSIGTSEAGKLRKIKVVKINLWVITILLREDLVLVKGEFRKYGGLFIAKGKSAGYKRETYV